ncbi:MAG: magnesium transporter, partial [Candidatus Ventricola sp.]
ELSDWLRVLWKEARVGVVCGAALAAVNFLRMMIFSGTAMMISAVVSITLMIAIVMASSVGCLLPMGAKRLGLDPAVMASPMITTIVDAASLLIYFMIARIMLGL